MLPSVFSCQCRPPHLFPSAVQLVSEFVCVYKISHLGLQFRKAFGVFCVPSLQLLNHSFSVKRPSIATFGKLEALFSNGTVIRDVHKGRRHTSLEAASLASLVCSQLAAPT